ncbi:MAG: hypothetical protein M9916_00830 [Crocinitomicaceae bacterium]|nr:hypothetical protein [Crocinitomicaceae bacterium]
MNTAPAQFPGQPQIFPTMPGFTVTPSRPAPIATTAPAPTSSGARESSVMRMVRLKDRLFTEETYTHYVDGRLEWENNVGDKEMILQDVSTTGLVTEDTALVGNKYGVAFEAKKFDPELHTQEKRTKFISQKGNVESFEFPSATAITSRNWVVRFENKLFAKYKQQPVKVIDEIFDSVCVVNDDFYLLSGDGVIKKTADFENFTTVFDPVVEGFSNPTSQIHYHTSTGEIRVLYDGDAFSTMVLYSTDGATWAQKQLSPKAIHRVFTSASNLVYLYEDSTGVISNGEELIISGGVLDVWVVNDTCFLLGDNLSEITSSNTVNTLMIGLDVYDVVINEGKLYVLKTEDNAWYYLHEGNITPLTEEETSKLYYAKLTKPRFVE